MPPLSGEAIPDAGSLRLSTVYEARKDVPEEEKPEEGEGSDEDGDTEAQLLDALRNEASMHNMKRRAFVRSEKVAVIWILPMIELINRTDIGGRDQLLAMAGSGRATP